MLRLTPRLVRRTLLPASYLVFFVGILASAAVFYAGKPFDARAAILSDLQSPDDNPHGYGAAAAGTAVSAVLLIPAIGVFYQRLRKERPKLALAGAITFGAGLASAVGVGVLAPFTHGYTPVHIQLASAAFIGICAGTWFHLLVFQFAALLVVVFLCYGPVDFNNSRLLTGLAFWEWVLCVDCGVALWALAGAAGGRSHSDLQDPGTLGLDD